MEKTMITKAVFYLAIKLMKVLVKRNDNKIGLEIVNTIDETFHGIEK